MSKESDLAFLTLQKIAEFIPSERHERMRFRIQKVISPTVLAKLDISNLDMLTGHLSPSLIADIKEEALLNPEFISWLVSEDDAAWILHKARKSAAMALMETLDRDDEGDAKILSAKIKAADIVLKMQTQVQPSKVSNTLKISALPSNLRSLAGKSTDELAEELRLLRESN